MKKIFFLFTILMMICLTTATYAGNPASIPKNVDYQAVVAQINTRGDQLIQNYTANHSLETMDGFSQLYFDHYEASGMELAVAALSPNMNVRTEALFTQLIGLASTNADITALQTTWQALKMRLHADFQLLQRDQSNGFIQAFLQAFSILLREGFEALLIVTALLAYLRRSAHADKTYVIYTGVICALVASAMTAILFATLFKNLGANREAMEGITMLIASAVLFYVSYWLFAKREAEKWQQYIKTKMNVALSSKNMFALGIAAFLAVYREGAETILFYQALLINNHTQTVGIITGFSLACVALCALFWGMQTASFKIPYRFFFTCTALFLYYMAFSFIGGGILELQEAGWIAISPIHHFPQIPWLGIFPAWQNVSVQFGFLILTFSGLIIWHRRNKRWVNRS